jgi:hypothetical protein
MKIPDDPTDIRTRNLPACCAVQVNWKLQNLNISVTFASKLFVTARIEAEIDAGVLIYQVRASVRSYKREIIFKVFNYTHTLSLSYPSV